MKIPALQSVRTGIYYFVFSKPFVLQIFRIFLSKGNYVNPIYIISNMPCNINLLRYFPV